MMCNQRPSVDDSIFLLNLPNARQRAPEQSRAAEGRSKPFYWLICFCFCFFVHCKRQNVLQHEIESFFIRNNASVRQSVSQWAENWEKGKEICWAASKGFLRRQQQRSRLHCTRRFSKLMQNGGNGKMCSAGRTSSWTPSFSFDLWNA